MQQIKNAVLRLVKEEDGAAASEYAILVALIASAVAVAVGAFDLSGIFTDVGDHVKNLISGSTTSPEG